MDGKLVYQGQHGLASPYCTENKIYFITQHSGDLYEMDILDFSKIRKITNTGGQPASFSLVNPDSIYITDFAHKSVLYYSKEKGINQYIKEYDSKLFLGPNSIAMGKSGALYFTDSGSIGTTSISRNLGSVFIYKTELNRQILTPILYKSLAHPSGIAVSEDEKYIFISEMLNNRILRCVERPKNVYNCSVFKQLSGSIGPSCICLIKDYLFIAHYDYAVNRDLHGFISIVDMNGETIDTIEIEGPEITGMCADTTNSFLYITEASTDGLYQVDIRNIIEVPEVENEAVEEDLQ